MRELACWTMLCGVQVSGRSGALFHAYHKAPYTPVVTTPFSPSEPAPHDRRMGGPLTTPEPPSSPRQRYYKLPVGIFGTPRQQPVYSGCSAVVPGRRRPPSGPPPPGRRAGPDRWVGPPLATFVADSQDGRGEQRATRSVSPSAIPLYSPSLSASLLYPIRLRLTHVPRSILTTCATDPNLPPSRRPDDIDVDEGDDSLQAPARGDCAASAVPAPFEAMMSM